MVLIPQELVPTSIVTEITSLPSIDIATLPILNVASLPPAGQTRLYGPGRPIPSPTGPLTIYTVPTAKKTLVTSIILVNTDASSPPMSQHFSLSIGVDAEDTRIFDFDVPAAGDSLKNLDIALEAGEFLQATVTAELTLTVNGQEVTA